jgi:hypothetical protein
LSLPAFPAVDSKPQQPQQVGPPRQMPRGPGLFSPVLLAGAALCLLAGAVGLGALVLRAERPSAPAPAASPPTEPQPNELAADEPVPATPPAFTVQTVTPAADPEPEPAPEPQAASAAEPQRPGGPPARAFTARCKAPGGGCAEQCATLAGGRCLDPCFVHTESCSPDCMLPDGTCGWPPPDAE